MYYKSTRNGDLRIKSANAIAQGISEDGGLFVPCEIPALTEEEIRGLADKTYAERAKFVFGKYLTDFTDAEIAKCVDGAYNTKNFESENIAELSKIYDSQYILELWHGPTCAFKDMALQILPYFLVESSKKAGDGKETVILVATSGDTGKAALEGFKDVEGVRIIVFYPEDGVSDMQKRQMATQEGKNVDVCAIKGNFDDAQSGVKAIFTDASVKAALAKNNMQFSSANSINWGRLAPQIVYYVSTYAELLKKGEIKFGEKLNVVVPTGNFGNILAAYYAKKMGVPLGKLICASNANNVLTDFINTGVYDRNRSFYQTISPSMDILISSNLERLLFDMCDENDSVIKDYFGKLASDGKYEVNDAIKAKLSAEFYAGCCDDDKTKATIKRYFNDYGYLCDTHTAVALSVYDEYKAKTGDTAKTVIASTASPYKFAPSVLEAIAGKAEAEDPFAQLAELNAKSGLAIPEGLAGLKDKEVRFKDSIDKSDMTSYILNILK
ncbi:MAG: threonine synthase [Oscillospiraceae bacterium]